MENNNLEKDNMKDKRNNRKIIKRIITYIFIYIIVAWVFNNVLMLNFIPSESMENTIMTGDLIISTRYDIGEIERYDIVVFEAPDSDGYYIKRVIGLPGETITVKNGKVYAGVQVLDDSFIAEKMNDAGDGVYKVPENSYFMMGDNRNNSYDSRFWDDKYVEKEKIIAKAKFIMFPISNWENLN